MKPLRQFPNQFEPAHPLHPYGCRRWLRREMCGLFFQVIEMTSGAVLRRLKDLLEPQEREGALYEATVFNKPLVSGRSARIGRGQREEQV